MHRQLESRLSRWAQNWLGHERCETWLDLAEEPLAQVGDEPAQVYLLENGIGSMYFIVSESHIQHLGEQIFAKARGDCKLDLNDGSLARAVVLKAFAGLGADVLSMDQTASVEIKTLEAIPGHIYVPGSGCVCVTVYIDHCEYRLLLTKSVVDIYLPTSTTKSDSKALESSQNAIRHLKVQCKARLGTVEVTFGDLVSLQVGDVIRLQETLDQPVALISCDGAAGCVGSLGSSEGKKALKIVSGSVD
ncbi:MAG: FliM/FliN family flagellar motor C-terminal domain-containing protein [Gammaproteobacteria bacterium]|nr:FliM/FliN family flagellar motor C-terminal domain-containing protein [Gammaproteobacteria bacterium]